MQIQRILVPIDFSDHSARALDYAIELAQKFGAEVRLLNAYPVYVGAVSPYGLSVPESFEQACRDAAKGEIESWGEKVTAAGVPVKTQLSALPPAEAIARYVEEQAIDLVVMGTRGLSGFKHFMLGSVAERTLRSCECPILTVRGRDESA